jgi:hypothetical protein
MPKGPQGQKPLPKSFLGGLPPSIRAARLTIVEALRAT